MSRVIKRAALKAYFKALSAFDKSSLVTTPPKKEEVKSILVVATTAIGDTVLSTPALRAINEAYPGARITALAGTSAAFVLANNPRIDKMEVLAGKANLGALLRARPALKAIKREGVDLAVVLHGNDPVAVPAAYLSGARYRLGMVRTEFEFLLNWCVKPRPRHHALTEKLVALKALNIDATDTSMEIYLTKEEETEASEFLAEGGVSGPIIAIHPFGSKPTRHWPKQLVARMAERAKEELGLVPVILGGDREAFASEEIAALMGERPLMTAGKLGLRASSALIKMSKVIVTTDSGPMHIASALGVGIVALFGAAVEAETGPLGDNAIVISKEGVCDEARPCTLRNCEHMSCMTAITVDEVIESARRIQEL